MNHEVITMKLNNLVIAGFGASDQLGPKAKSMGAKKVLLVADKGVAAAGIGKKMEDILKKENIGVELFDNIVGEPDIACQEACVEAAKKGKFDFVVGVGGGSAMDVASITAVMITNPGRVVDYAGLNLLKNPGIRSILIPTTAGTGAEATMNAVLSDPEAKGKKVLISPYILPDVAIIDPLLHLSMPASVTSASGMDALCHAIEAYTHFTKANIMTDLYAREAIAIIGRSIRTAVAKGDNLEARYDMAIGSYYAGVAISNAGVTAVHALSYPLGVSYHVPHGVANGMLLPYVMEFNVLGNIPKFAAVAKLLGQDVEYMPLLDQAYEGADEVKKILMDMKMAHTLADLKIPREALLDMARAASGNTRLLSVNPRSMNEQDILGIYESCYE